MSENFRQIDSSDQVLIIHSNLAIHKSLEMYTTRLLQDQKEVRDRVNDR